MKLNVFSCSSCGENHKGVEVEAMPATIIQGIRYSHSTVCPVTKVKILISDDDVAPVRKSGLKIFIYTKEDERILPLTTLYDIMMKMDFVAEIEGLETRILKNRFETRSSIETENLWDYLRVLEEWRS